MSCTGARPLLTVGEAMGLLTAVTIGHLEAVTSYTLTVGGAESNVAVAAARLGHPVTWVGRLGADAVGDLIAGRLRAAGVTVNDLRDPSFTGLMIRHQRNGAAPADIDYHRAGSAAAHLTPDDLPDALIAGAALVHLTGITAALSSTARAAVVHAADTARRHRVPVSFDVNYRRKLWPPETARPALRQLAAAAHIVFAGVEEAQLLLDTATTDPVELCRQLAALGPAEVVVKDGSRGCVALIDGNLFTHPPYTVPVIDTVGAGVAFAAGYLTAKLVGAEASERLREANLLGAYAVTIPGDCELLPTRAELDAFPAAMEREDVTR